MPPSSPDWGRLLREALPDAWARLLEPATLDQVEAIGRALGARVGSERIVPHPDSVFRALALPPEQVRILLVGQDPYPNAEHAMGLSFSVPREVRPLPGSLRNIRTELADDLRCDLPDHGDLTAWLDQGVLLLNRHLTTAVGQPGAHQSLGWDVVTNDLIRALVQHQHNFVAILWGKQAAELTPLLADTPIIRSAHPSPLSAHRGFFGSKPFSRANALLARAGVEPVQWCR